MLELVKNEMVHIGDLESDIEPSKVAGVPNILIDYTGTKTELYDSASAVVTEFKDIPHILKKNSL